MFEINPNAIYTAKDLAEVTGKDISTVYRMFENGLAHNGRTKTTTGRAILAYHEREVVSSEEAIDLNLAKRIKKAGIVR